MDMSRALGPLSENLLKMLLSSTCSLSSSNNFESSLEARDCKMEVDLIHLIILIIVIIMAKTYTFKIEFRADADKGVFLMNWWVKGTEH